MDEHEVNMPYSLKEIIRYISGNMTEKEMHELENASLEDAFLAHALEGYQNVSLEDLKKMNDDIKIQLYYNPDNTQKNYTDKEVEESLEKVSLEVSIPQTAIPIKRRNSNGINRIFELQLVKFFIGIAASLMIIFCLFSFISKGSELGVSQKQNKYNYDNDYRRFQKN
jgi:hypothetical protein